MTQYPAARYCLAGLGLLIAACSASPPPAVLEPVPEPPAEVAPAEPPAPLAVEVAEAWVSEARPEEGIAALAVWPGGGDRAWVIAAAAATDRLLVLDAGTGEILTEHGATGEIAGRFRRPAGLAVVADLLLVAEAEGGRVQALRLPGLSTAGFLGAGTLRAPGVLAAVAAGSGYEVWIGDDGEEDGRGEIVHLLFTLDGDSLRGEVGAPVAAARTGGDTLAQLAALVADPARGRLLVAERMSGGGLWVLDADGRFAGRAAEGLAGDPPGLALFPCGEEGGWWIVAEPGDSDDATRFRLLDRITLEPAGSFTAPATAGSSAVAASAAATPELPAGAVYALGHEGTVTAFDWSDIASALDLPDCERRS